MLPHRPRRAAVGRVAFGGSWWHLPADHTHGYDRPGRPIKHKGNEHIPTNGE